MKGEWEGIPGEWINDDTAIDGRRFVAAPYAIREMRKRMRLSAKNRCEFCANWAYHGERHHVYGRGIGGGKKEDRPQVNGVRFVVWTCRVCHDEQTIKSWGSWTSVALVNQRSLACKGLVICMVLFCAYMQWSPVVDLDYVWINGYEHYVGAVSPHKMGSMVLPALPQPLRALRDVFASPLRLPLIRSTQRLVPATTLRL